MHIYISADMEGASGISSFHQVNPASSDFDHYRRMWTRDINALTEGCLEAGADEILVNEGHDGMNYLYPDQLHPAAQHIAGRMKSKNQMEGIDGGFDLSFLLCHAMAGQPGTLSHSFVPPDIWEMRLNGKPIGEIGLNIYMSSWCKVPVGLIVGDSAACAEARDLVPDIYSVVTKEPITQFTARCFADQDVQRALKEQAAKAVRDAASFQCCPLPETFRLDVTFTIPAMVELISYIPGVEVTGNRSVAFESRDYLELTRVRILIVNLARMVGQQLK